RRDERVGVRLGSGRTPGGLLVGLRIGDRDGGEPRLDSLAEGHAQLRRRLVERHTRGGRRAQEGCVGERGGRRRQRPEGDGERGGACPREPHASVRLPFPPTRARIPTTSAAIAITSAMISSVDVPPPPPSESTESIVGDGVSELSSPFQSTTEPSEYVW